MVLTNHTDPWHTPLEPLHLNFHWTGSPWTQDPADGVHQTSVSYVFGMVPGVKQRCKVRFGWCYPESARSENPCRAVVWMAKKAWSVLYKAIVCLLGSVLVLQHGRICNSSCCESDVLRTARCAQNVHSLLDQFYTCFESISKLLSCVVGLSARQDLQARPRCSNRIDSTGHCVGPPRPIHWTPKIVSSTFAYDHENVMK